MAIRSLFARSFLAVVTLPTREALGCIAVFVLSVGLSYFAISQIHLGSAIMQIVTNVGISDGITGAVILASFVAKSGRFNLIAQWKY